MSEAIAYKLKAANARRRSYEKSAHIGKAVLEGLFLGRAPAALRKRSLDSVALLTPGAYRGTLACRLFVGE